MGKSFVEFVHPDDVTPTRKAIAANDGTIFPAARDISSRITMEEALRASSVEKDALLKEVHHRVKNNMQVISSLLDLETMKTGDPGFLRASISMECSLIWTAPSPAAGESVRVVRASRSTSSGSSL